MLNRIDEQIVFDHLSEAAIRAIALLRIGELQDRLLKDHGIDIDVVDEAVSLLARLGYDERSGARELNRAIERLLEMPLSERILASELRKGARVVVSGEANKLKFEEQI